MLPIPESVLKAFCGHIEKDYHGYEVGDDGDVFVGDEKLALRITKFSAQYPGGYPFKESSESHPSSISPSFDGIENELRTKFSLPIQLIKQLHAVLDGYLSGNPDEDLFKPWVRFGFRINPARKDAQNATYMFLESDPWENNFPGLNLNFTGYHPNRSGNQWFVLADRLATALLPFTKIKAKGIHVDLLFNPGSEGEDNMSMLLFDTKYRGHRITTKMHPYLDAAALRYGDEEPKEEKSPKSRSGKGKFRGAGQTIRMEF